MLNNDHFIPTLTRNDWVIRFFKKLKMSPILVFFSVALFNLLLDFCLAKGFHAWDSTPTIHGLSMEPGGWAIDFIAEPLLFATYFWVNAKADTLIGGLIKSNKIQLNERSQAEIEKFHRQVNSAWFSRVSILIGVLINLLVAWFLLNDPANPTWLKANIMILIIRVIVGLHHRYHVAFLSRLFYFQIQQDRRNEHHQNRISTSRQSRRVWGDRSNDVEFRICHIVFWVGAFVDVLPILSGCKLLSYSCRGGSLVERWSNLFIGLYYHCPPGLLSSHS
jgi:hypothetical protein